jgi:hypothetical protein
LAKATLVQGPQVRWMEGGKEGKAKVKKSYCNWSKINLFTAFVFIFYAQSNIQVDLVDLLLKCIYFYHFNGIYYI